MNKKNCIDRDLKLLEKKTNKFMIFTLLIFWFGFSFGYNDDSDEVFIKIN